MTHHKKSPPKDMELGRTRRSRPFETKADVLKVAAATTKKGIKRGAIRKLIDEDAVIERIAEAQVRSKESGHRFSFRVDVSPNGDISTSQPVALEQPVAPMPVETCKPSVKLVQALAAARERGVAVATEIFNNPEMLSGRDFARLIGSSPTTVNSKRQNGEFLGLEGARRGFRYPTWQLDADGKPFAELRALQEILGGAWATYRLLVQQQGALNGLTGLEALASGRGGELVDVTEGIARGDFS
ncbi:XRE family transcriptional regulator [Camelimonas fluminis]|uniref:XRE family transcriptional regulator n=1 Tax=Camelimonas fluminis TaxID=1576911 RepID=A0ABV7UBF1_9HYPH|nr:XRE family transcriptional regulator [Camelimonas fluminis]GHE79746.1 XRE family transcriptional regulator [Camelimonas fluminis]